MKSLVAILSLAMTMLAGGVSAAVAVGDVAPNFKFEKAWNVEEGHDELTDYRGSIVLVEAWATW